MAVRGKVSSRGSIMQRELHKWQLVRGPSQNSLSVSSPIRFLLRPHLLFRADIEPRVRGVHRLGQLDSRRCL